MLKSTLLISILMLSLLLSCGQKQEKKDSKEDTKKEETSKNEEKTSKNEETSEEEKPTKKSKKKKESWAGIYEYFDKENNTNLVLTINKDNTYEIMLHAYKSGVVINGTLDIEGDEASLIFEDGSSLGQPLDKDYKKGDTFGTISKNQQEPLDIDIECATFGDRKRMKKVEKIQEIREGGM